MSQNVAVTIHILDKEYIISCPEEEKAALLESAKFLERRMRETRDGGKVLGTERISVMTALNVVHELLVDKHEKDEIEHSLNQSLQRLNGKIATALGRRAASDAVD